MSDEPIGQGVMGYIQGSKTNVAECPRCGKPHLDMPLNYFKKPMQVQDWVLDAWFMCPETNEPVIQRKP